MIKSLTNLENKKGPNYVKQKNFLSLFGFCFVLFVCFFFGKLGYIRVFVDRKTFKKVCSVPLYWKNSCYKLNMS